MKIYVGWVGFLLALVFTLNILTVSGITCRTPDLVQGETALCLSTPADYPVCHPSLSS